MKFTVTYENENEISNQYEDKVGLSQVAKDLLANILQLNKQCVITSDMAEFLAETYEDEMFQLEWCGYLHKRIEAVAHGEVEMVYDFYDTQHLSF